jgi:hypothetical protein
MSGLSILEIQNQTSPQNFTQRSIKNDETIVQFAFISFYGLSEYNNLGVVGLIKSVLKKDIYYHHLSSLKL